jgi:hypothetical protein
VISVPITYTACQISICKVLEGVLEGERPQCKLAVDGTQKRNGCTPCLLSNHGLNLRRSEKHCYQITIYIQSIENMQETAMHRRYCARIGVV